MLVQNAPVATNNMDWDLNKQRKEVETEELRTQANGMDLGTKTELSPKALAAESNVKGKKYNPSWTTCKTCWSCGKISHLRTKCTAMEAEKVNGERANATEDTDKSAMCTENILDAALVADKPSDSPRPWVVDSGCSSHFSPNREEFIDYIPFHPPLNIHLGNSSLIPSLGMGTVLMTCTANGKCVTCKIHEVQYVPDLSYALLSGRVLIRQGLWTILDLDGICRIQKPDGTIIVESLKEFGPLFYLNHPSSPTTSPKKEESAAVATMLSFDLVHKRLAHPGKDTLKEMIRTNQFLEWRVFRMTQRVLTVKRVSGGRW
jgi:hypothetical protein